MKRALICGVLGQDGSYLADLLINKGYEVWGTSRDAQMANMANHKTLGIVGKVNLISMAQTDFRSVLNCLTKSQPDEIYFLSGQSSVGLSFEQPVETIESTTIGVLNLLEAVRFIGREIKVYHASSSECFGDVGENRADEVTSFHPRSPYGVAKASAHMLVANYREAYGLFASNGILFNHESPLRPERFVTQKIISTACRIAAGIDEKLCLGRLDIVRDWGWAPEYVDAMWRILQADVPDDILIATGVSHSLEYFVSTAFDLVGLEWQKYVITDKNLFRPSEISFSYANPDKALEKLGWKAVVGIEKIIENMISFERERHVF